MDNLVKEILRSWNWPTEDSTSFFQIPNPSNISRKRKLNPTSVYRKWKFLFESGYVKKVMLLPADSLVNRYAVMLKGVEHSDFASLTSKVEDKYFLEKVHFYRVYEAGGNFGSLKRSGGILFLEFIGSSPELKIKQAKLISEQLSRNSRIIPLPQFNRSVPVSLSPKLLPLLRKLSYSNLYEIDVKSLGSTFNISNRTVRRWFNILLKNDAIFLFPILNQSLISGFNTFVVNISDSKDIIGRLLLKKAMNLDLMRKRYLLYRFINDTLNFILYYDFPEELDDAVNDISSLFKNFAVFYRHETFFNEFVERRI
ncbi:MAG: hypothetical protein QXV17_09885 [Candidatus Micrarchaeaceae archaeon]